MEILRDKKTIKDTDTQESLWAPEVLVGERHRVSPRPAKLALQTGVSDQTAQRQTGKREKKQNKKKTGKRFYVSRNSSQIGETWSENSNVGESQSSLLSPGHLLSPVGVDEGIFP